MRAFSAVILSLILISGGPLAAADPLPEESIVINEVMYNPGDGPVEDPENALLEYVELYNRGAVPMDVGGWSFSNGILYTFPDSTLIEAGGFLVVAKDPASIESRYGVTDALGPFVLRLDDGGEKITLKLPPVPPATEGLTIDSFSYDDEPPWPVRADGDGSSLERINPFWSNDAPGNWEASGSGGWFKVELTGTASSDSIFKAASNGR